MRQGIELQFRKRSRLKRTSNGEALTFGFSFGPIQIFVIAHLPEDEYIDDSNDEDDYDDNGKGPLVYIKITLAATPDWPLFRDHSKRG